MAHAIQALLSHYDAAYFTMMGVKALIGAKDAALAKRLLATYTLEQLTGWVDGFFASSDPFIRQSGYTFGVFSACLAKVIAADRRRTLRAVVQQPDADLIALRQRIDERNMVTTRELAEDYYRTHPWVKRS